MSQPATLGPTKDFPPGSARAVTVEGRRLAVFHHQGKYCAFDDVCPHAGAPLSEGRIEDDRLICPWHEAAFDMATGAVLSPPANTGIKCYRVFTEGNELKVEL